MIGFDYLCRRERERKEVGNFFLICTMLWSIFSVRIVGGWAGENGVCGIIATVLEGILPESNMGVETFVTNFSVALFSYIVGLDSLFMEIVLLNMQ